MSLQVALLILGVIVVISVAVGTMDQSRRRQHRRHRLSEREPEFNDTVELEHEYDPSAEAEPVPWVSASLQGRRALSADAAPAQSPDTPSRKIKPAIYDELDSIEAAIDTRLDVDPEIDTRHLGPSATGSATQLVDHPMAPDEKIDFIVTLPSRSKPISRDHALGIYKQNEYILEKPRGLYGLRHVTNVWSNLDSDPISTEYTDLRLAIQLADNAGPVNESELNAFTQLALKLADPLKRRTLFSMEFDQALKMAKLLDAFCKDFDVVASINIVANGPVGFMGINILHEMSVLGFEYGRKNVFHKHPDNNKRKFPKYSLANLYDPGYFDLNNMQRFVTKGLTLFMQVPCVREPGKAFREMVRDAQALCNALDGKLLDQDSKPLTSTGIEAIERQISDLDARMRERGIAAGSDTAIRLFDI